MAALPATAPMLRLSGQQMPIAHSRRGTLANPASTTCNGNGDGIIENSEMNSQAGGTGGAGMDETLLFWQHMALAGLISGSYTPKGENTWIETVGQPGVNVPSTHISGGCYAMMWATAGTGYLFVPTPSWDGYMVGLGGSAPVCASPLLSTQQARNIDSKIDDGLPSTGNVQTAPNPNSGTLCNANNGQNPYNSNSAITCNTSLGGPQCALLIKAQF